MKPSLGQRAHGFTVEAVEDVPEIDGTAYRMRHDASGARLLYLANDDANKAFSISFKTPPADDTGVFHILEHSVLCGSRKFPVKEPFVSLLKTSMQTFLNAMTFPDKTMYPVASTNMQDLMNLADVYLDAVLHPAIFEKRTVFEQEGWHYELSEEGALRYNGVVYNEMKGALSNPESVLYDALSAALFPDTAYRFESGGDPKSIPDLTYESYLDTHRRHYRLDNSYLVLYGDLDLERMLAFLDEDYLAPGAAEQASQNVGAPNPLSRQAPVAAEGVVRAMETAPENAMCGLGFVVGDASERRRLVAADVLVDAVFGSNESPLKRAVLDAGIADDATAFLADGLLQPFVVIQTKNAKPDTLNTLSQVVRETCERLAREGIDRDILRGSIASAEFALREHDFGYADGVALAVSSMAGWLYDDANATSHLRYEEDFAALREAVDEGYFERLLTELFLENGHRASVELRPCEPAGEPAEAARLAEIAATLSDDDRTRIAADAAALRCAQEAPDAPEAVAALPRLSRADIGEAPAQPPYRVVDAGGQPCVYHAVRTHGIAYAYRYYDISDLPVDDLPYATILALVLGKLGTARRTAAEVDSLVQNELGALSFFLETYEDAADADAALPRFVVGASALSEKVESLTEIVREIMLETEFSDTARISDALVQKRVGMEQGFANAGHSAALARAEAHVTPAGALRDLVGGVGFYRFLKGALADFDASAGALAARLSDLAARIFSPDRLLLSFGGSEEDFARFVEADAAAFLRPTAGGPPVEPAVPAPRSRRAATRALPGSREAFAVPTDVVYAARAADRRAANEPYTGVWQIASRALSYDFLWNEVRVKGGAYGAGFQAARAGALRFYSYRDPHLDETLARYRAAGDWIGAFDPDEEEMDGYVVSSVAGIDAPKKPRDIVRRQAGDAIAGRTPQDRARSRAEMIAADAAAVRALAPAVVRTAEEGAVCVFGNAGVIAAAAAGIPPVDLLTEPAADLEEMLDEYRAAQR